MIEAFPLSFLFLLGAAGIPLFKGRAKPVYLLLIPILALLSLLFFKSGTYWELHFLGYPLVLAQVDRLSVIVALIFIVIGFLSLLYSLPAANDLEHIAAFLYMGSSLGVVFAGDFFSLFVYWEIMAISSVVLIWARKEKASLDAGFRYLLLHALGGSCLMAGIVIHYSQTGSIAVEPLQGGWGYILILIGFGLNTAFIPLHVWLPDAYPEGTVAGSVFLSVYTTKTGVYVLARCFPGVEGVALMGGAMAVYGVVFALLQNDVRRLLSYHIISQVGYMVAGVGIGTSLGINGGIGHVFNHILYKALLFMCMGSVIFATGRRRLTELGGLAKKMPVTAATCVVAALSISGAPGFNGFISKGMVISAAVEKHWALLEWMLLLASVGTFLSFVKLCFYTFFAKNDHLEAQEVPGPMQGAMIVTALLCFGIGLFPQILYQWLPFLPVEYHAYTPSHVLGVVQLFLAAGLVFWIAQKHFSPHRGSVLDWDYFYRQVGRLILHFSMGVLNPSRLRWQKAVGQKVEDLVQFGRNPYWPLEWGMRRLLWEISENPHALGTESAKAPKGERKRWRMHLRPYDEDLYRGPIGMGVGLALILLFLFGLIYLHMGRPAF